MPTTLTALLILLFAIVPGMFGEMVYRIIAGTDWRENQWSKVARIIGISIAGLVLYIVMASLAGLPVPQYLFPSNFSEEVFKPSILPGMAFTYVGHAAFAALAGTLGAYVVRGMAKLSPVSTYPDTWDVFARDLVPRHWVVVTLTSGVSYAGMVERADFSVQQSERDIVLAEPALYIEEKGEYVTQSYQYLFLPGALVDTVAVYYDPAVDERVTPVNQNLFMETADESEENND